MTTFAAVTIIAASRCATDSASPFEMTTCTIPDRLVSGASAADSSDGLNNALVTPLMQSTQTETSNPESPPLSHGKAEAEGMVIAKDENGTEHLDTSGFVDATFWDGDTATGRTTIYFQNGHFTYCIPCGQDLGINRLSIDGHFAKPEFERIASITGRPIVIRGRVARPLTFHIVDAITKEELRDVTVIWNDDSNAVTTQHPGLPGPGHLLAENAMSPVEIVAPSDGIFVHWIPKLYAHTRGRAWASVRVDFREGGESQVELEKSGDLEIRINGPIPSGLIGGRDASDDLGAGVVIRVRKPIGSDELSVKSDDTSARTDTAHSTLLQSRGVMIAEAAPTVPGPNLIEGLAPGRYLISLERGNHWDNPQVIASSEVEIVECARTVATLTPSAGSDQIAQARVRVSGTVHYSNAWLPSVLDLVFRPITHGGSTSVDGFRVTWEDFHPIAGQADLYEFSAGERFPGRYLVTSYAREFQQAIDIEQDGTIRTMIMVGDPVDVVVHLLDSETGEPLSPPPALLWNCARPVDSGSGSCDQARWDDVTGTMQMRVPAGAIDIRLAAPQSGEYMCDDAMTVTVAPEHNEFTFRIHRK
jgi:hypothetical protein